MTGFGGSGWIEVFRIPSMGPFESYMLKERQEKGNTGHPLMAVILPRKEEVECDGCGILFS